MEWLVIISPKIEPKITLLYVRIEFSFKPWLREWKLREN